VLICLAAFCYKQEYPKVVTWNRHFETISTKSCLLFLIWFCSKNCVLLSPVVVITHRFTVIGSPVLSKIFEIFENFWQRVLKTFKNLIRLVFWWLMAFSLTGVFNSSPPRLALLCCYLSIWFPNKSLKTFFILSGPNSFRRKPEIDGGDLAEEGDRSAGDDVTSLHVARRIGPDDDQRSQSSEKGDGQRNSLRYAR